MATEELHHWLALSLLPGIGPVQLKCLHQIVLPLSSWQALTSEAVLAAGFAPAFWQALEMVLLDRLPDATRRQLDTAFAWMQQPRHHALTLSSPAYPPLLLETTEPPPVLFVQGHPEALALPQIGMVGSRNPTADGRRNARHFAAALVRAGYQITSGLAQGIDAESHAGALDGKGVTIAVFGTGLNMVYPRQNLKLAAAIAETGALVSELLPDAGPAAWNFPQRNRIISGLTHGVLVVEAAQRSGSLITARLAAEQGREVFVLPGSIHNPMARGCHQLIRQGAKLVETVADVLEELPALLAWEQDRDTPDHDIPETGGGTSSRVAKLPRQSRKVLDLIAYDPVSVDELVLKSGIDLPALYSCLMELELRGLIEVRAGAYVLSTA